MIRKRPSITISLIDEGGSRGSITLTPASGISALDALDNAQALAEVLPSGCACDEITWQRESFNTPWQSADSGSDVRGGATLLFQREDGEVTMVSISGILGEYFLPSEDWLVRKDHPMVMQLATMLIENWASQTDGQPLGVFVGGIRDYGE